MRIEKCLGHYHNVKKSFTHLGHVFRRNFALVKCVCCSAETVTGKKNTAVPTVFMYGNVDLLYPCTQHFKPQKQGQQNISGECEEQVDYGGLSEHVKLTSKHQHMQTAEAHLHYVICSNYLRRCSSTTKCFQQNK